MKSNFVVTILALASLNVALASALNTLENAVDTSNRKRLEYHSRSGNSGIKILSEGMSKNIEPPNRPQTLVEAVAAQESKRLDIVSKTDGLAVEIVDRKQDSRKRPRQTLGNRLDGSSGEGSMLGMKDTDNAQSIEIETNYGESKILSEGRGIDYIPVLEASFDRRAYEISGTEPSSGSAVCQSTTVTALIAAIGLVLAVPIW